MIVSCFRDIYDTTATIKDVDWYDYISSPVERLEKGGELITTSIFENNSRKVGNLVIKTPCLFLDFDGTDNFFSVCEKIAEKNINFYAYTTFSHTKEIQRFRILLPCEGLTPHNYSSFSTYFCLINNLNPDKSSRQAGRIYYPPIVKKGGEYMYAEAGNKNNLIITPEFNSSVPVSKNIAKPLENLTETTLNNACFQLQRTKTERNNTLYRLAFKFFLSNIPKNLVSKKLYEAAKASGLSHSEIIATINSAMIKAKKTAEAPTNRRQIDDLFK